MPRRLKSILAALILACATSVSAAPTEGIDYLEVKPPQTVDAAGKIEVVEFFWYRCPHCYALEPELEAWVKRLPRDVQFRRVPGILNDDWAVDARIFYTLEALGEVERLHKSLFNVIHQQGGVRLRGDAFAKWTAEWLAKQGVDPKKYDEMSRSFSVQTKVNRATQLGRALRLDGVPTLVVHGRYIVVASNTQKSMLDTTDFLVAEIRKQGARAGR